MPDSWAVYNTMKADEAMKGIPVIVMTVEPPDSLLYIAVRVDDYITKPFKPEVLLQSVNRVLGEE